MLNRFAGLFHQTRKSKDTLDKSYRLGVSQEDDIETLMTLFPLMQETMGLSLEALEAAHNELSKGTNFDKNFAIAVERFKAARR